MSADPSAVRVGGARIHLLAAVLLLASVAALCIAGDFDGLCGQDAFAYYDYAIGPLRDSLLALQPLPAFFWPPGYPLFVALASLITGPTPFAGQVVSLLMGTATVVFTGLLAGEVWTRGRAEPGSGWMSTAAALLVACHPQLWQSSAVVMADTTGLAAATLGAWALARYARVRQGGRLLTFNLTFTFQHYSALETHELYAVTVADLPALLADGRATYVLIDEQNIEEQWGAELLGATYHWLRDERGLTPLAQYGKLTLARVQ